MKGNLKSWVFMFAVAGVIALVAACGAKGDTGAAGNCPELGSADVNPPSTTLAKPSATTFTLTCNDGSATISGATTVAGTCGNSYYSKNGGTWTLYPGSAVTAAVGDTIRFYSYDKACNSEAVNTTTM